MSCMHLMLVSPARRRIGLDSTGRGVAPAALNVVRSGIALEDNQSIFARTHLIGCNRIYIRRDP